MLLLSFFAGTQVWLYFFGLHRGNRPECTAKVFIYANVNMYNHHWVTFLKVVAVFGAIGAPFIFIEAVALIGLGIVRSMKGKDSEESQKEEDNAVQEYLALHPATQPQNAPGAAIGATSEGVIHDQASNIGERQGVVRTEEDWKTLQEGFGEIAEEFQQRSLPLKAKRFQLWLGRFYLIIQGLFGGGLAIVWIERTIIINDIDLSASPVYSSGQLLLFW
jgi:hypothetical protein